MSAIQNAADVLLYVSDSAPGAITAVTDPTDPAYDILDEQIGHSSQASRQTERVRNKVSSAVIGDPSIDETITINVHLSRQTAAGQATMDDAFENNTEVTLLEYPDGSALKGKYFTGLVTGRATNSTNPSAETLDYTVQVQARPTSFTTPA